MQGLHRLEQGIQQHNPKLVKEGIVQVQAAGALPEQGLSETARKIANVMLAKIGDWDVVVEEDRLVCEIKGANDDACHEAAQLMQYLPWKAVRFTGTAPKVNTDLMLAVAKLTKLDFFDMRWAARKETLQFLRCVQTTGVTDLRLNFQNCFSVENFPRLVPNLRRLTIFGTPSKKMMSSIGVMPNLEYLKIQPRELCSLSGAWVTCLFGRTMLKEIDLTGFRTTVETVLPLVAGNEELKVTASELEPPLETAPAPVSPRRRISWRKKKESTHEPLIPSSEEQFSPPPLDHDRITLVKGWGNKS